MNETESRRQILQLVRQHARQYHATKPFVPGKTRIPVAGRTYGEQEMQALVESALDFWLTAGRFNDAFEKRIGEYLGIPHVLTTNSGSSSNLLAIAALTSDLLEDRALRPGDEVITVAAAFPTTVNPIVLYGLIPVFVDVEIPSYNIAADYIEAAITDKTRAIVLAHTLGNPFNVEKVMEIARKYNLWVVEDCCDALGSRYKGQMAGTFGDIGTSSYYPAHHITTGEGGAVFTANPTLKKILESLRDWGRDCSCAPGSDNRCGKRFSRQFGTLPAGYDHKYVYSHAGYNLKMTEMQAAIGLAQMDSLEMFTSIRKNNFRMLSERLDLLKPFLILPEATPNSDPSWFGFPITVRDDVPLKRNELLMHLHAQQIDTRLLFSGNITRQPYFKNINYRISRSLTNTDIIMNRTFWIGLYPGLNDEMLDYMAECITSFVHAKGKA